jgi:hypothetical protein
MRLVSWSYSVHSVEWPGRRVKLVSRSHHISPAGPSDRTVLRRRLWSLGCWDSGLESRLKQDCLSLPIHHIHLLVTLSSTLHTLVAEKASRNKLLKTYLSRRWQKTLNSTCPWECMVIDAENERPFNKIIFLHLLGFGIRFREGTQSITSRMPEVAEWNGVHIQAIRKIVVLRLAHLRCILKVQSSNFESETLYLSYLRVSSVFIRRFRRMLWQCLKYTTATSFHLLYARVAQKVMFCSAVNIY